MVQRQMGHKKQMKTYQTLVKQSRGPVVNSAVASVIVKASNKSEALKKINKVGKERFGENNFSLTKLNVL